MEPMIKYRGGKSREIKMFQKYIPEKYDTYIEPFLGGGAVFFFLEPENAILNDINEKLMRFYREVRNEYGNIRSELDALQSEYEKNQRIYKEKKSGAPDVRVPNGNEDLYYSLRMMYNGTEEPVYSDGALYFFINKTAYSGMIRYNSRGDYNVPFGRYPNFNAKMVAEEHSEVLQRAKLYSGDYEKIFAMAGDDDFMFLDPPYDCIFNDYGNIGMTDGFNESEHRRLAKDFFKLTCKALMVIGKTDLTMELYGDLVVDEYAKNYAVNIRNRFKAGSKHIVVCNYDV